MKDLVIKVGEYDKDGQTKGKYLKLGVIMSGDNGEYALIEPDVNLAGALIKQSHMNRKNNKQARASLMVSIFDRDNQNQSDNNSPPPSDDFDF